MEKYTMKMEFSYSVFLLLCLLPETSSLIFGTTETCGIIGKEFTLVCNFSGVSWNPSSTRDWRGPPSLTLLISGGTVQPGINGYVESTDSVNTDSAFRLHIQSLAWSNVDVLYQCIYRFDTESYTISSSIVEDYNSTHDDVQTDNTNGKNILATINLDAITPVPTVTALLNSLSGTSDVTSQAITITSTPNANNAALNTVNITVNYTVSDTDNNITVNLATPCGYTKSYTFKQGPTTEPPRTIRPPSDHCDCPALPCLKVNGFCVLWIIVIAGVGVVSFIIILSCIIYIKCRKKDKETKKKEENNKLEEKQLTELGTG